MLGPVRRRALATLVTAIVAATAVWFALRPEAPQFVAGAVAAELPTTTAPPPAPAGPTPALRPPFLVATPHGLPISLHTAPEAALPRSLMHHDSLRPIFLVKSRPRTGWLEVYLHERPNGSTAFIKEADVALSNVAKQVKIEVGARRLTAWDGDKVIADESVAVGAPRTPTPLGTYYLFGTVATGNPRGAYGPYILALSAHSEVHKTFGGGDGLVGIHGTNALASIGNPVSNGCIRMSNAMITMLAKELPLGTPIVVVP